MSESLNSLPDEILLDISSQVVALGSSQILGLIRVNRRFRNIATELIYKKDIQESGGFNSMSHGLKKGLNDVVKRCLKALGANSNLRIESHEDLDSWLNGRGRHIEKGHDIHSDTSSENPNERAVSLYSMVAGHIPFHSEKAFYWTPLHVAAIRDDVELLDLLLSHGANPNAAGRGVCTCNHLPVRRTFGRSFSAQKLQLEYHYDRERWEEERVTSWLLTRRSPLHVAVCKGNLDCAERLIDHSGLPHDTEENDVVLAEARRFLREESEARSGYFDLDLLTPQFDPLTPLHIAADKYTSLEALERLHTMLRWAGCLDSPNSDVDIPDAFGDTPLAVAAFSGRIQELGTWLRDHGADVNFPLRVSLHGSDEHFPLLNALCQSQLYREASLLMDLGVDINRGSRLGSALNLSCGNTWQANGHIVRWRHPKEEEAIVLIDRLIKSGADVNARDQIGNTALMSAAYLSFSAAARKLLESGADVGAVDDEGISALHLAVENGLEHEPGPGLSAALVTMGVLLDHGADPNQRSEELDQEPPLFRGVWGERHGCGILLADIGPPFPFSNKYTKRPHSMASIAPLLISRGADPNIFLQTPRDLGKEDPESQVRRIFRKSLAVQAFYYGEFDSLDSLAASGTVITRQDYLLMMRSLLDRNFRSPGAKSDAVEALFRILRHPSVRLEQPGDSRNIMDAWAQMLYKAVGSRPRLVHALAPHVDLAEMTGPGGMNVLHIMARWEQKPYEKWSRFESRVREVMADLMSCGAKHQIDQLDKSGQSPLQSAINRWNVAVAKALVDLGASCFIEHTRPDGTTAPSPFRSAIRKFSHKSRYEMAIHMLDAIRSKHALSAQTCGSTGLLKDVLLHIGDVIFNEVSETAIIRTTSMIERLIDRGVDVNESDKHGDTALHVLFQLLYRSSKSRPASGILPEVFSDGLEAPAEMYPELHLWDRSPDGRRWNIDGQNFTYQSDSDYDDGDPPDNDLDDGVQTEENSSNRTLSPTRAYRGLTYSLNALGEWVRDSDYFVCESLRCQAWIRSFFSLLDRGASVTKRNESGKTVLDYIDELRNCEDDASSVMYRPVISALKDLVKRPPFEHAVLASFKDQKDNPKGQPQLFVHRHIRLCLGRHSSENLEKIMEEDSAKDESCWVPFW